MKKIFKGLALFLFFLGIMLLVSSCATTYTTSCDCKCIKYSNPNVIKNERYGYS